MNEIQASPLVLLAGYWGWALFHSIWLLAVVALALGCVLRIMKGAAASARYAVMVGALLAMALAPVLAFWYVTPAAAYANAWSLFSASGERAVPEPFEHKTPTPSLTGGLLAAGQADAAAERAGFAKGAAQGGLLPGPIQDFRHRMAAALDPALPWIVALWMLGVMLAAVRLACGGLWIAQARRRTTEAAPEFLQAAAERFRAALKLSAPIRVMKSSLFEVPMVLGWLRPVILFPASALTGLTPHQLETIIAHELAHLARHDPLVNVLQTIIETVLFYHPAVWWVSGRIREERELCCDDLAVTLCGDRIEFARALTLLEAGRSNLPATAFSAAHGPLLRRIQRMLQPDPAHGRSARWVSGMVMLFALTALFTLLATGMASHVLAATPGTLAKAFPASPMDFTAIELPQASVGSICTRRPGTDSYFDWRETVEAAGNVVLSPAVETAIRVAPERAGELAFLDAIPPNTLAGLLSGVFFAYRAGNEPPDRVYANLLQREDRARMPVHDGDMAHVARLEGLRDLYLDHAFVGDGGVALLGSLSSLEVLSLVDTEISDEALGVLAALPNLRRLNLSQTAVTDAGLALLSAAPALEDITLDRTAVTDAGMPSLAEMKQLRRVSLNFTAVTDVGVAQLAALPRLTALRTWHTGVSEEVRATVGRGTGPNELNMAAPKVGIILSEFTATGETWMEFEYTHRHPAGIAQLLLELGYDLYAVIDPGTEETGYLPEVLECLGLQGRTVNGTDPKALAQLDVVVSGHNPKMLDPVIGALATAVKNGMGFVNTSVFGNRIPSESPAHSQLLGVDHPEYSLDFEYIDCRVAASHPILGNLQPGDTFTVKWLNGVRGKVHGTPLLTASGTNSDFCPLYTYDLGRGHVVNIQWQQVTISNGDITPVSFYGRCVNHAAGIPVDATW